MAGNQNFAESGMSSATERRSRARAERKRQLEAEKAAHITPGADIIIDWIDEELAKVCDMREMVLHITDKELARDELIARKLHMDFLESLKLRAKNMVRMSDREAKRSRDVEAQLKRQLAQEKKMLSINEEETYQEALDRHVKSGASREDVVEFMQKHNDNVIDFDALPDQKHNWHDQGEKLSCWDAGHPMHQVWKPRKKRL